MLVSSAWYYVIGGGLKACIYVLVTVVTTYAGAVLMDNMQRKVDEKLKAKGENAPKLSREEKKQLKAAGQKKKISPRQMHEMADKAASEGTVPSFLEALKKPGISFICEVKKASPSKGLIAPDFPYLQIAKEYEAGGASAISCLTEPHWFLGSDEYLKDFTVDTDNTKRLIDLIPDDTVFVSESGIKTSDDVQKLREMGADAVLIGETLMRACDKKARLKELAS